MRTRRASAFVAAFDAESPVEHASVKTHGVELHRELRQGGTGHLRDTQFAESFGQRVGKAWRSSNKQDRDVGQVCQ